MIQHYHSEVIRLEPLPKVDSFPQNCRISPPAFGEELVERISNIWPRQFEHLLEGVSACPRVAGCWCVDVVLSETEIKELNLFEGSARHRQVCFRLPGEQELVTGQMNPPLGLGAPTDPSRGVARVRISFHGVDANLP